ncbi:MAG: hypothetical protein ABIQ55_11175 [Gemmatimonadaceae bacterium]
MSEDLVDRIADALLFEGYMLYPYRPTAVKNRQRFNFGVIYPLEAAATEGPDAHLMQTECLVEGSSLTTIEIRVRFLHLIQRTFSEEGNDPPWQEAVERSVSVPATEIGELLVTPKEVAISYDAGETREPVPNTTGRIGVVVRRQHALEANLEISATEARPGFFRIRVQIRNAALLGKNDLNRDDLLLRSLVSTHTILSVTNGEFISLLDPPLEQREIAAACHGVRSWPVLVGEKGHRDTMLSSPIIIYDYPLIAVESAGDLFDGTEIDEILSLRILTMTDEEKDEMRRSDERGRVLLERTERLNGEQFMRMHGTMRGIQ